jgi:hypothetical protein
MPARAGALLLVVGVVAYLLVPGHPLSLLRGVPLDWLGLAALISVGCLIFAFGLPAFMPRPAPPHPNPLPAGEGAGASDLPLSTAVGRGDSRAAQRAGGRVLLVLLCLMVAA